MPFATPEKAVRSMQRFGVDDGLVGDLLEQHAAGRSSAWLFRQALAALVFHAVRDARRYPTRTAASVVAAWGALILLFIGFGDRLAGGLATAIWGWTRPAGSDADVWWPFWVSAAAVSYAGYAIAACVMVRSAGRHVAAALLTYTVSVLVVLLTAAMLVSFAGPIHVWHPLFYVISVGLAYQWRLGFLLVPFMSIACGLARAKRPTPSA